MTVIIQRSVKVLLMGFRFDVEHYSTLRMCAHNIYLEC